MKILVFVLLSDSNVILNLSEFLSDSGGTTLSLKITTVEYIIDAARARTCIKSCHLSYPAWENRDNNKCIGHDGL